MNMLPVVAVGIEEVVVIPVTASGPDLMAMSLAVNLVR